MIYVGNCIFITRRIFVDQRVGCAITFYRQSLDLLEDYLHIKFFFFFFSSSSSQWLAGKSNFRRSIARWTSRFRSFSQPSFQSYKIALKTCDQSVIEHNLVTIYLNLEWPDNISDNPNLLIHIFDKSKSADDCCFCRSMIHLYRICTEIMQNWICTSSSVTSFSSSLRYICQPATWTVCRSSRVPPPSSTLNSSSDECAVDLSFVDNEYSNRRS